MLNPDHETQLPEATIWSTASAPISKTVQLPESGLIARALHTGHTVRLSQDNIPLSPEDRHFFPESTRSYLIVPICISNNLLGLFCLGHTIPHIYDEYNERLVLMLAQAVGIAQHNIQFRNETLRLTEHLREERDFALQVMGTMGQGLTVTNQEGVYEFVNNSFAQMLGSKPEEVIGQTAHDVTTSYTYQMLVDQLESKADHLPYTYESTVQCANGSSIYVLNSTVLRKRQGQTVGLITVTTDLTERRQHEELRRDKEAVEATAKAKSAFLANVSHELRTPLNGLLGMLGLLQQTPLDREQQEYLCTATDSGETLLTLINDILDLSKLGAGKLALEHQPFDLRHCIQVAVDMLKPKAEDKRIALSYHIDPATPINLLGDITRLRQIIINLLHNGIKFTEEGGVFLRIISQVTAEEDAHHLLHFMVRDSGIGIRRDKLKSIFEPFQQAESSTARLFGGTGLGLSISRSLTEMMGGRMWAESEGEYHGATFHFTIRMAEWHHEDGDYEPITTHDSTLDRTLAQRHPLRILLAEDNIVNQKVAQRILERMGYTVDIVTNGYEALEALRITPYDLILMDVQMPEMDGVTATQQIRQNWSPTSQPFIVAMTANAMKGDREKYLAMGMDGYISKPFQVKELVEILQRCQPLTVIA